MSRCASCIDNLLPDFLYLVVRYALALLSMSYFHSSPEWDNRAINCRVRYLCEHAAERTLFLNGEYAY